MTCRNTLGPSGMTSPPENRQVAVGRRDRGRQLSRSWRWLDSTPTVGSALCLLLHLCLRRWLAMQIGIRAAPLLGQSQRPWPLRPLATSSSGHFVLWPLRALAILISGQWPLRALATSTSGLFVLWPLWIHPVWASGPLLANSTSDQCEFEDLINSWPLCTHGRLLWADSYEFPKDSSLLLSHPKKNSKADSCRFPWEQLIIPGIPGIPGRKNSLYFNPRPYSVFCHLRPCRGGGGATPPPLAIGPWWS